jgi:hypothetical protein
LTPTALDYDRHGILLDDGAYPGEGSEATVVSAAVLLQSIREEQVTVQTHGHPLILLYVLKVWKRGKEVDNSIQTLVAFV